MTLASGDQITIDDLPEHTGETALSPITALPPEGLDLDKHLQTIEKGLLSAALERTGGNRTEAAKALGMTCRSFRYRLAKFGMDDEVSNDDPDVMD